MLDVDTFLTALYVMIDDLCQYHRTERSRPGPNASLCRSEVITLATFGRWRRFASERDFYRYAEDHLREAFPTLPDRSQFNRLVRLYADDTEEVAVKLAGVVEVGSHPYQALDASAMPVRDVKRRGHGWLAGAADIGWSNSIGWYEGFSLLTSVEPSGVITGFCFAPASTADQPLAETFFAVRLTRIRDCLALERPSREPTWPTRVSRVLKTTGAGSKITEQRSYIRPSETPKSPGPSP